MDAPDLKSFQNILDLAVLFWPFIKKCSGVSPFLFCRLRSRCSIPNERRRSTAACAFELHPKCNAVLPLASLCRKSKYNFRWSLRAFLAYWHKIFITSGLLSKAAFYSKDMPVLESWLGSAPILTARNKNIFPLGSLQAMCRGVQPSSARVRAFSHNLVNSSAFYLT